MRAGLWYQVRDEKKADEELATGKAQIGIHAEGLLDELNILELQTEYDAVKVLCEIKRQLLVLTGKLIVKDEVQNGNTQPDGNHGKD